MSILLTDAVSFKYPKPITPFVFGEFFQERKGLKTYGLYEQVIQYFINGQSQDDSYIGAWRDVRMGLPAELKNVVDYQLRHNMPGLVWSDGYRDPGDQGSKLLSCLGAMLQKQWNGEYGPLATDGRRNVFQMRVHNETLPFIQIRVLRESDH